MDEETILQYAIIGIVAYVIVNKLKDNLLNPDGYKTSEGLANSSLRMNVAPKRYADMPDRTFLSVGDTTYSIKDADLKDAGFVKRRSAFVGALPEFLQFDWLKKWVYE